MNWRTLLLLGSLLVGGLLLSGAWVRGLAAAPLGASPTPLPAVRGSDGRFGIDFVTGVGYDIGERRFRQATDAGARFTRWPIYWHAVETEPGRLGDDAYQQVDAAVAASRSHGLQVSAIILGTPQWAATGGTVGIPFPKVGVGIGHFGEGPALQGGAPEASPPQNLYAPVFNDDGSINQDNYWARFVYTTVLRYRGRVKIWEMWNEPDLKDGSGQGVFWTGSRADYYRLLQVGYLAAKKADPSVTVLFAGLAYWTDQDFLPAVLDMMKDDTTAPENNSYFDVLPWHLYVSPYFLWDFPVWSRAQMEQRGFVKPVWVNEANIPVCGDEAVDPGFDCPKRWRGTMEEQANFVIQAYALAAAAKVPKVFIFQHYDDNVGPHEWYGLVRNDASIRPSYVAYQAAARYLSKPARVSRKIQGSVDQVVLQGTPRGRVTVLWNRGPEVVIARLRAHANSAILATKYGLETTIAPQEGFYSIELPGATYRDPETGSYDVGGDPFFLIELVSGNPSSQVEPLPQYAPARRFRVRWQRLDQGEGSVRYDVQYRDGADGAWVNWLSNTTATSARFGPITPTVVREGHTYYFRSRARDDQGNQEPYPGGDGDAQTTVPYFIRGQVTDHVGLPVAGAQVVALSTPFSATTRTGGLYRLGVYPTGSYEVVARKDGFGHLPTKRLDVTGGLGYFFVLPPEVDAVANGGFEDGFTPWRAGPGIYLKSFRHTGEWGAYLSPTGRLSQLLPPLISNGDKVLSFVYRVPSSSTTGELKVVLQGRDLRREYTLALAPDDVWRHRSFRLPAFQGPLTLIFWVTGEAPVVWLDEVSLGAPGAKSGVPLRERLQG